MAEKILVVDDDLETLRLVGLMLERKGYQTVAASDGIHALQQAAAEKPDVILLDVMMPNMDGFEISRRLRANPATARINILIFTAKTTPADRARGMESGADDYVTKPTHPEELAKRIKALISRPSHVEEEPVPQVGGRVVGFLSAKGGVGLSTLALNTGIALQNRTQKPVLLAEFRPGYGVWGQELGTAGTKGLDILLGTDPDQISFSAVERELVSGPSGLRLLLASSDPGATHQADPSGHYQVILSQLTRMAPLVLVDLGATLQPGSPEVLGLCDELVIAVEPHPITIARTRQLIDYLARLGFGLSKGLTIALINRVRSDVAMSWSQVQESLDRPVKVVFTPAPELAYQAAVRSVPMITLQAASQQAQQFDQLAGLLAQVGQDLPAVKQNR